MSILLIAFLGNRTILCIKDILSRFYYVSLYSASLCICRFTIYDFVIFLTG